MTSWVCTACHASFEGDEPRCPKCLKKSSVLEAGKLQRPQRARSRQLVAAIIVGSIFFALFCASGWELVRQTVLQIDGVWVPGHITHVRDGRYASCSIDYEYGTAPREGSTTEMFCSRRLGQDVRVLVSDQTDATRLEDSGELLWTLVVTAVLGAMCLLMGLIVAVHRWPKSEGLRAFADGLGVRRMG